MPFNFWGLGKKLTSDTEHVSSSGSKEDTAQKVPSKKSGGSVKNTAQKLNTRKTPVLAEDNAQNLIASAPESVVHSSSSSRVRDYQLKSTHHSSKSRESSSDFSRHQKAQNTCLTNLGFSWNPLSGGFALNYNRAPPPPTKVTVVRNSSEQPEYCSAYPMHSGCHPYCHPNCYYTLPFDFPQYCYPSNGSPSFERQPVSSPPPLQPSAAPQPPPSPPMQRKCPVMEDPNITKVVKGEYTYTYFPNKNLPPDLSPEMNCMISRVLDAVKMEQGDTCGRVQKNSTVESSRRGHRRRRHSERRSSRRTELNGSKTNSGSSFSTSHTRESSESVILPTRSGSKGTSEEQKWHIKKFDYLKDHYHRDRDRHSDDRSPRHYRDDHGRRKSSGRHRNYDTTVTKDREISMDKAGNLGNENTRRLSNPTQDRKYSDNSGDKNLRKDSGDKKASSDNAKNPSDQRSQNSNLSGCRKDSTVKENPGDNNSRKISNLSGGKKDSKSGGSLDDNNSKKISSFSGDRKTSPDKGNSRKDSNDGRKASINRDTPGHNSRHGSNFSGGRKVSTEQENPDENHSRKGSNVNGVRKVSVFKENPGDNNSRKDSNGSGCRKVSTDRRNSEDKNIRKSSNISNIRKESVDKANNFIGEESSRKYSNRSEYRKDSRGKEDRIRKLEEEEQP